MAKFSDSHIKEQSVIPSDFRQNINIDSSYNFKWSYDDGESNDYLRFQIRNYELSKTLAHKMPDDDDGGDDDDNDDDEQNGVSQGS